MRPFDCLTARNAQHAVELLARYGADARLLAGGTDLLVDLKAARDGPRVLVDLTRAADLKGIALTPEGLTIGALTTHAEIARSPIVREHFPVLVEAVRTVGAVQTRNLGTIGGNLVTAVPSMDSGPALLALDAQAGIAGPAGRRRVPLDEFFLGPRKTVLAPGELLADLTIPIANLDKPMAFYKFGLRKGQALALVNVAAGFNVLESCFRNVRIALGAVAPTLMRARESERWLEGRGIDFEAMTQAGAIAAAEAKPISDFRASADYRRDLIAVLTRRALHMAWERARAECDA